MHGCSANALNRAKKQALLCRRNRHTLQSVWWLPLQVKSQDVLLAFVCLTPCALPIRHCAINVPRVKHHSLVVCAVSWRVCSANKPAAHMRSCTHATAGCAPCCGNLFKCVICCGLEPVGLCIRRYTGLTLVLMCCEGHL